MTSSSTQNPSDERQLVEQLQAAYGRLREELKRVVVGQDDVIEQLMIAMLCGGHALLVGTPGLAKTLLIRTLSGTIDLSFSRIQFTPDLMPVDITGTEVIEEDRSSGKRHYRFIQGPVFANVVLADEINRTPPKTQAALLEAMQEKQVTAGGVKYPLPQPFFVLATRNPIEQEGTYPLPEAQLDRFLFEIHLSYPSAEEEFEIVKRTTEGELPEVEPVLSADELIHMQNLVKQIPVADHLIRYAMQFARLTRADHESLAEQDLPEFVRKYVNWGAGPRASQYLVLAAKARALLNERVFVKASDIQAVAKPVLRHRLFLNFNAEVDGVTPDDLVEQLIELIPPEPEDSLSRGEFPQVLKSPDSE